MHALKWLLIVTVVCILASCAERATNASTAVPRADTAGANDAAALHIVNQTAGWMGDFLTIDGEVKNEGTRPLRFVKVSATFYGPDGGFRGVETTAVRTNASTIEPGETASFRIMKRDSAKTQMTYRLKPQV